MAISSTIYRPQYRMRRVGLLGGSFNPAHEGHRMMSLYALKRLKLDEIWWLVSPQNPLKSEKGMAPFETRLANARRIARHPKILVSDQEALMGTRFTVDTLRALKQGFPAIRFVWLTGADNLREMPRWKSWKKIVRMVPIADFRRKGYPVGKGLSRAASQFSKSWQPLTKARNLADQKAPCWLVLDNKLNLLSATAIRRNLRS